MVIMIYNNLVSFLKKFPKTEEGKHTHTIYGGEFTGSFTIPPERLDDLYKLVHRAIFVKKNEITMIEKVQQICRLVVDLDFKYKGTYTERQYTQETITELIQLFLKTLDELFNLDILDGSPPCSTFSQAGRGEDKNDKEEVIYSDTVQSNIGYLIFEWVYLALVSLPKICIIENVENIEKSEVFKNAITKLKSEYIFNYRILNSGNYGVPQKRKRLIGIGVRKDIARRLI